MNKVYSEDEPFLIEGKLFSDHRGVLKYNNDFNALQVKRLYSIENMPLNSIRGWQAHKIEKRWFIATKGSFIINVIVIDNWQNPSQNLIALKFILKDEMDVLFVPAGCATSIQAISDGSKLLVMSNYQLNEVEDDFRFEINYWSI
jgi:dTDP-4-dehydrorhamnose 3,5-epimerase-like enzyme